MAKDRRGNADSSKNKTSRKSARPENGTVISDGKSYQQFRVGDRLDSRNARKPRPSTITAADYDDYANNFVDSRPKSVKSASPGKDVSRAGFFGNGRRKRQSLGFETGAPGSQIKDILRRQLPRRWVRITASVISSIIFGILTYQIFMGFYVEYKTEVVSLSPYLETIDVEGIAVRDEQIVNGTMSSTSVMTVQNGDRVSLGETILNVFSSESEAEAYERSAEIDRELQNLYSMVAVSENTEKTVNMIGKQLDKKMVELNDAVQERSFSDASKLKSEISFLLNKQLIAMRQVEGFNERIEQLEAERDELQNRYSKAPDTVKSPGSGYFSDRCDGYETLLNTSMIGTMTVDTLREIIGKEAAPPEDAIGKLVNSFSWYLLCPVPAINSDFLIEDASYTLYLPYSDNESVQAVLKRLDKQDGQDEFLAVFRCSSLASELCAVRRQPVKIVKCQYEGFAIPKSALHAGVRTVTIKNPLPETEYPRAHMAYVADVTYPSVYAIVADQIREKEVVILYGTDNTVICTPKYSGDYLSVGDTVVIQERGLYNGKLVN